MILICYLYLLSKIFLICEGNMVPTISLNDGRAMPTIAIGTWLGFNDQGGLAQPENHEVQQAVELAIDAGYRHVDTASLYGTEGQVGRAVNSKIDAGKVTREEMFVTTKLWVNHHARDAVVPALRASLDRLALDYVDLYLIHFPCGQYPNGTFDLTDYLETWQGMMEAKRLGLTKSIGLSSFSQNQINRILENGLEAPAVLQVEINLTLQQPELLAYCKDKNISVTGYTPFGSLYYASAKPAAPKPRIDDPLLLRMATAHNKTVPQIVLRYLLELGVTPLPKALKKAHIEDNIKVFDFELSHEDKQVLKSYDSNYRTLPQTHWKDHPHYPFHK